MYRIAFVLEQALGHVTHAKNLMANVPSDPEVTPYWGLVPWETCGPAARLPLYRSNWTVRAGLRARALVGKLAEKAGRDAARADRRGGLTPPGSATSPGSAARGRAGLDALFFHTQVPAILAIDWLRRIPGVVSLDATPIQYDQLGEYYGHDAGPALVERYKWHLNRDCFRAASHLVTWAVWTKRSLVADYAVPAAKITVIPPGVNTEEWRRPVPRVPHGGPVKILFVGANLERKGGRVLLEAFHRLATEAGEGQKPGAPKKRGFAPTPLELQKPGVYPELELHLVTRDVVAPERGVFVYNDVSPNSGQLKQLYHECDIFCLPTFGDCLPMVLSEAGAAGLPAVTTDMAGIPEIVIDGETGLLVPRGDVPALTAALRRLVCDEELRLRLGMAAAERVSLGFDAPRNTARLLDLLKQVCRADPGAAQRANQARLDIGQGALLDRGDRWHMERQA